MTVKGAKTLNKRLKALAALIAGDLGKRLDDQARRLQGRAVAVAPELERTLILSSKVGKEDTGTRVLRSVSFDTPYALVQHEGVFNPGPLTAAKAPTQDGPAGRKYLERPFRNMQGEIIKDVGEVPLDVAKKVIRSVRGDK